MNQNTFKIVSLGCAKNTVDADSMAQLLTAAGFQHVDSRKRAKVIIVNTCGFMTSASEESYAELAKLASRKKQGQILIAAGCLAERYGDGINSRVPGVDAVLGTRRWMDIADLVRGLTKSQTPSFDVTTNPGDGPTGAGSGGVKRVTVQGASAYLKIADGCSRQCAFCAIPLIKGPTASRPIESIVSEAVFLQERGVREIVLLAQNSTDYGLDLGLKNGLARLLRKMTAAAPGVDWIRIMYAFPGGVTDELIEVMATHKQIVPYIDLPLQHAHPDVLRRMGRPADIDWVYKTLEIMRKSIPDLALRSTFIVGYPGETESEFQYLLDFIGDIRFDRLGTFKFSFEKGTPAEALGDPISDDLKEERLKRLMEKQQPISLERNQDFIGRELKVLVEGSGDGVSIGRSYRDAPEVDGLVIVKGQVSPGKMIQVHIDDAMVYDLGGSPV
ncbi:30S ribosomal protein S12 methylthiotransferase RimO [Dehalogenimonas formicexedens]|nr:30S ribosomal protein S12 methylthiotransferase RimO [Dehalogenimonas formicexedens]